MNSLMELAFKEVKLLEPIYCDGWHSRYINNITFAHDLITKILSYNPELNFQVNENMFNNCRNTAANNTRNEPVTKKLRLNRNHLIISDDDDDTDSDGSDEVFLPPSGLR